jgi:hypothetical protein
MKTGSVRHRLGNYERSTGKEPQAISQFFCIWPKLKYGVIAGRPIIYLLYILAVIGTLWTLAPRFKRVRVLPQFHHCHGQRGLGYSDA